MRAAAAETDAITAIFANDYLLFGTLASTHLAPYTHQSHLLVFDQIIQLNGLTTVITICCLPSFCHFKIEANKILSAVYGIRLIEKNVFLKKIFFFEEIKSRSPLYLFFQFCVFAFPFIYLVVFLFGEYTHFASSRLITRFQVFFFPVHLFKNIIDQGSKGSN